MFQGILGNCDCDCPGDGPGPGGGECCDHLPAEDLTGQVELYDRSFDSAVVIPGPFRLREGVSLHMSIGARFQDHAGIVDWDQHGTRWYESDPVCWKMEVVNRCGYDRAWNLNVCYSGGRHQVARVVIACASATRGVGGIQLAPIKTRVYVFLTHGQRWDRWEILGSGAVLESKSSQYDAGNCADNVDFCVGDPLLDFGDCYPNRVEYIDGNGELLAVSYTGVSCLDGRAPGCHTYRGALVAEIGADDTLVADGQGLYAPNCEPLCIRGSWPAGGPAPELRGGFGVADVWITDGTVIGVEGTQPEDCPPPDPSCWATLELSDWCGGGACGGDDATFRAVDDASGAVFGPRLIEAVPDGEGGCLLVRRRINVRIPHNEGVPMLPRTYTFYDDALPGVAIHQFTVTQCGERVSVGDDPPRMGVRLCVTGCPSGPMTGIEVEVEARKRDEAQPDDLGDLVWAQSGFTAADGCVVVEGVWPDPPVPLRYRLRIRSDDAATGYAETIAVGDLLPAGRCETIDIGTFAASIAAGYVCTCAGPASKCLTWSGNGATIEVNHVDASAPPRWEGSEYLPAQANPCALNPDAEARLNVTLTLAEVGGACTWTAVRVTPLCFVVADPCPRAYLEAAEGGEVNFATTKATWPAVIWGPTGTFSPPQLNPWAKPDGGNDPDYCHSSPEGYTPVAIGVCTASPMMMASSSSMESTGNDATPLMRSVVTIVGSSEPPRPPLLRSAGHLARHLAAEAVRVVRREPPVASADEQERRWSICRSCAEHYRPSDRSCGADTGCGCNLDIKIPRSVARCPLNPPKWGPVTPLPGSVSSSGGTM